MKNCKTPKFLDLTTLAYFMYLFCNSQGNSTSDQQYSDDYEKINLVLFFPHQNAKHANKYLVKKVSLL